MYMSFRTTRLIEFEHEKEVTTWSQIFCSENDSWSHWCEIRHLLVICVLILIQRVVFNTCGSNDEITPNDELIDAASKLFPHISNPNYKHIQHLQSPLTIKHRPDIQSFGFDLGFSTCACTLQSDQKLYWQRVFYGSQYVTAHVLTVFLVTVVTHDIFLAFLWKISNEIGEELALPIFGRWAGVASPLDTEPRYDSIVKDLLFAVLPFGLLCYHFIHATKQKSTISRIQIPSLRDVLNCDKSALLYFQLLYIFLIFYFINTSNNLFTCWDQKSTHITGNLFIKLGKLWNLLIQIVHLLIVRCINPRFFRVFFVYCICICLIWLPFILHFSNYDEQIQAMLSFAITGTFICWYQIYWYCYFDEEMDIYSKLILSSATVSYNVILIVYLYFPVSRPIDFFFANRNQCGLSTEDHTKKILHNSCFWINPDL